MSDRKPLRMSFDPHTIEHLGIKMYSNLPNALAELIANAYDADATEVTISLIDEDGHKRVEVIDDGVGMRFDEINAKFLRIGRNRRDDDDNARSPLGRAVTGKKGLGKLALFGLGHIITISTTSKGSDVGIRFELNWEDLKRTERHQDYEPHFGEIRVPNSESGTKIVLDELNRTSAFRPDELATSISKLFSFFDDGFKCFVRLNDEDKIAVTKELKFEGLDRQFEWKFPEFARDRGLEFEEEIRGEIFSTKKPLKPGLRGISLYARGRLVNAAEFFAGSESSYVYSYLTGFLSVDFIDNLDSDVIATNRQSLNWEVHETIQLRKYLSKVLAAIAADWRKRRTEEAQKDVSKDTSIDVAKWKSTLPETVEPDVSKILRKVADSEGGTSRENRREIVESLHSLVPEYPNLHWRHLHPKIQEQEDCVRHYQNKDYYAAFSEAVKLYVYCVEEKSGLARGSDHDLMGAVFGDGTDNHLSVTKKYEENRDFRFREDTFKNIQRGQMFLSQGVIAGGRNVVAHPQHVQLRESGLFKEKDCLDALSIISHLMRRLDEAVRLDEDVPPDE